MKFASISSACFLFILAFLLNSSEGKGGRGGGGRGGGSRGGRSRGGYKSGSSSGSRSSGSGSRSSGKGGSWSVLSKKTSVSPYVSTSSRFKSFAAGAGVGYLSGKSSGMKYYFIPKGYHGYSNIQDENNVCYADISVHSMSTKMSRNNITTDSFGNTRVYFLCDGTCCESDCCEINGEIVAVIVVCSLVGLCCCCVCCVWLFKSDSDESESVHQSFRKSFRRWTSRDSAPRDDKRPIDTADYDIDWPAVKSSCTTNYYVSTTSDGEIYRSTVYKSGQTPVKLGFENV